jgi:L-gulonolactone oxidase
MTDTVCVTGGSGGIGQALLEQLAGQYRVKALFRTRSVISDIWERRGCVAVWGDIGSDEAVTALVTGVRFVFHCAAMVAGPFAQAHAVNVEGTRRLARIAAAHGCERFVHVSSAAVYGGAMGDAAYVEETELRERDDMAVYPLTKLQAEWALKEAADECGLEYAILRPTCVYGPRTKPYTLMPIRLIRRGVPVILGDGHGLMDVVYVEDVARALVLAAQSPAARGGVFNIGHETVTLNDFYARYGRMLNRPVRHVPVSLLSAIARLLPLIPGPRQPRRRELRRGAAFLIRASGNTKGFPSVKASALFGYTPEFTLSTGMLKTELWAKREGLVPPGPHVMEGYGPLPFVPESVVYPRREEELVQITRIAREERTTVRAIGSLHSLSPIPTTDGICVVLDQFRALLKVEGCLVTVQAGMKLRDLNDALARLNLALPSSGSIAEQTVSGAISTATHGGSMHVGGLGDCVEAVRIVRADGTVVDVGRSQDLFSAVVVSLGLLGIISTVTFRCVPAFVLRSSSTVRKAVEVLEEFDDIHRRNVYVDMLYFPVVDEVEILSTNHVQPADEDLGGTTAQEATASPSRRPGRLSLLGVKSAAHCLHHCRCNPIQRIVTRRSVGASYRPRVGRSDRVLAFSDLGTVERSPLLVQDMEIAVAHHHARAAIGALRSHFMRTRQYPLLPIHIRCSPRSALWLSPAYQRDVCWLEFWQYPRSNDAFRQIHELLKPFQYRCHWGKECHADRDYVRQQYDRWEDFAQLRREWDPGGLFLNRYLESFFPEQG